MAAQNATTANRPVHEIRMGAVKAAIWRNETKNGYRYNVRISRLYKDNGEWKTSDSFGRDELPLVSKVVNMAYVWIYQSGQRQDEDA